ncbi:MAG TPA: aconitase X catalytic domain-containing protein [Methanocorpusculum sp.]|mgnify:FL=1|nr:aconitase X catalytic domain-containing protein [Methanocorpusculum sp.]MBQ3569316.1 aconitase X catalytic domain-containing protein [Methanocorpusculum sp.]HJJ40809.1 aconitase X catalytic domain-containing protein [Methanocorpusculum sp.]
MQLDKYDQALLDGEYGETKQKMMEILVSLGKIYDAERLIEVKNVQVSGASFKTIGDAGLEWLNSLSGKAVVPSFLNPIGMPREGWESLGIPGEFGRKQLEVNAAYTRLGIRPSCTCTPYYFTLIERGDHLAWSESSAVVYANSVLGARTNREGGPSALASALTGKTPEYGLHIVKNRLPEIEFRLADPEAAKSWTQAEYGALGIIAGAISGNKIPLFKGIRPKADMLKSMGAAMAASGAVALFHVEDITPEARFPFFKKHFAEDEREVITIENEEIKELFSELEPEAVAVGCPHLSRDELQELADLLDGRTVKMPFYVFAAAEMKSSCADAVSRIQKSGARVIPDTCMIVSPLFEKRGCVMTNSGKAFTYLPGMCDTVPRLGSLEDCVRVACGE